VEEEKFEDIRGIKPEEPQVPKVDLKPLPKWLKYPQVPKVDLKPLPKGLKYEFWGPDKTYLVIVRDELSPEENEKLLNWLKKHKKVIDIQSMISKDLAQPFALIVYLWKTNVSP
jgi:hypothetical protein